VLFRKHPERGERPQTIDWIAAILNFSASAGLLVGGALRIGAFFQQIWPAALVFGALGTFSGVQELRKFLRPPSEKNFWWFDHLAGMIGSYIAAVTAFPVTQI